MHAGYIGRGGVRRGVRCPISWPGSRTVERRTRHGPAGWCAVASLNRGWGVRRSSMLPSTSPGPRIFKMVRLPGDKNSIQSPMGPTRNPHYYSSEDHSPAEGLVLAAPGWPRIGKSNGVQETGPLAFTSHRNDAIGGEGEGHLRARARLAGNADVGAVDGG